MQFNLNPELTAANEKICRYPIKITLGAVTHVVPLFGVYGAASTFDSGWHHFHSLLFLLHISQCYQIFNLITAECDLCFTLDFLFLIFRYLQLISKLPWIKFLTWNLSVIMTSGPVAWGWGNASAGKWRNTVLCKNETLLIDSLLELVVLQIVLLLTLLSSTNVCHSIKEKKEIIINKGKCWRNQLSFLAAIVNYSFKFILNFLLQNLPWHWATNSGC